MVTKNWSARFKKMVVLCAASLGAFAAQAEAVVPATPSPWGKATPLWQDYVAGTDPDPAGSNATFRVTKFELADGVPRISYEPDLKEKRTYTTFGKERLDDPEEDWRSPAPAGARFFRVEVSLPAKIQAGRNKWKIAGGH